MTRKDYVLIAEALYAAKPRLAVNPGGSRFSQHTHDVKMLAEALALDNPRFDRERFLKAAGVQ